MHKCLYCNEDTKNPKFCSKNCAAKYNNKQSHHINSQRTKTKKCKLCDNLIYSTRTYCKECWSRKNYKNKTLGECIKKSGDYNSKKRGIGEHARGVYKKSNKPKKCLICDYSYHYDICHITPIKDFPNESSMDKVNNIDNLVALCKNHHWEFDSGLITKKQILEKSWGCWI